MMQFHDFRIRRPYPLALFLLLLVTTLLAGATVQARDAATPAGESGTYLPLIVYGASGSPPPPGGDFLLYAFSDALRLDPAPQLEEDLDTFKDLYCDTSDLPAPVTLSLAQARQNAYAYLQQLAGTAALDGIEGDLAGRSLGEIDSFVTAAIVAGETEAALAALLIAVERFPGEPMPLVNAAGLLSSSGLPNEAIAFLDAAEATGRPYGTPMGIDGEQIARNNRAHALLMRGQWAAAAAILEDVVTAEPQLAEARMNLSRALLCQGDTPRAALWYRQAQRRMQWDVGEDGPEINDQMIPIEHILDTSAGEILTVHDVPRPATAEQLVGFVPFYEQMNEDYNARIQSLSAERPALEDAYYDRTLPTLQQVRLDSLLTAVSFAQYQPQARALWDEGQLLSNELDAMENDTIAELTLLWQSGGELEQIKAECRDILSNHVTEYTATSYEYEHVLQEYMILLYAIQTGVLANAYDAPLHALMMNHIEANIETTRHLLVPYGWSVNMGNYWSLCEGDEEEVEEAADPLGMPAPGECSPGVKATKVGLDLRIVSFSITCEIAEVEIAPGGVLGPFLQVTHDMRRNEITAFFGAKATVMIGPVVELNAKEGFYVRANQNGFTDAGMKVATGGAAHLGGSGISGQVDGPEFEAGVAAAVEYWLGP